MICYNDCALTSDKPTRRGDLLIAGTMATERERFILFRIYRNKDQKAFGELYDLYGERIHRYLTFKLPTPADAEDLSSEVFARAWEYLQNTPVENPGGLLYRIAQNVSASFYRARGRRPQETELAPEMEEKIGDPSGGEAVEQISNELSIEAITKCLPRLKDEYRDVIIMRYLDEMSVSAIAEALEKNEGNVRMTIHRALKVLREILDQQKY